MKRLMTKPVLGSALVALVVTVGFGLLTLDFSGVGDPTMLAPQPAEVAVSVVANAVVFAVLFAVVFFLAMPRRRKRNDAA